jgi:hypothetical protein
MDLQLCEAYRTADLACFGPVSEGHHGRVLGPQPPDTLKTAHRLAQIIAVQGRNDEAAQILRQLCHDRQRVLGSQHPDTQHARQDLVRLTPARRSLRHGKSGHAGTTRPEPACWAARLLQRVARGPLRAPGWPHTNPTSAGHCGFPHKNPTDETALCGTPRHACSHDLVSLRKPLCR